MNEPKEIKGLLESVSGSLNKLDELDRTYNEARGNLVSELVSYLDQLAVTADSQATRAQVVREIYWNRKIPAKLIGDAFKLTKLRLTKIAGALVLTLPCPAECGNSLEREFKSRKGLGDYYRATRRSRRLSYPSHLACDECKQRAEAEKEAEATRKEQRNVELQNMAWEDFTETKEWIEIRNVQMYHADYQCERCHINGVGLTVYLGKDTPQNYPHFSTGDYKYYVLCGSCVLKCAELINVEKGEYIKDEFIRRIMDWNQGNYYEQYLSN
jgi:Pyruvate/2-oxoacid:ferredoxin oxidoreductase delta subunit